MPNPPYSPDIATYIFISFPKMKLNLKRTHHGGVEEFKDAVTVVLNELTSEDYQGCFESWVLRQRKNPCIGIKGDYCECR
ncbi:unnamed protein product, partial [Brenthis ino]